MGSWKGGDREVHLTYEKGERRRWEWNERGKKFRHDKEWVDKKR
jgi:hypothetical protein